MKHSSLDIWNKIITETEPEQKSYPHMNTDIPPLLSDDSTTTSVSEPTVSPTSNALQKLNQYALAATNESNVYDTHSMHTYDNFLNTKPIESKIIATSNPIIVFPIQIM